jgi:hypothetical protein
VILLDLLERLPLLRRLTEARVKIGSSLASNTLSIHTIFSVSDCADLAKLQLANEYRFETLPKLLIIRLIKVNATEPTFSAGSMVDCPVTDFQVTATDGGVRSYNLRATVEQVPRHVFSHVSIRGKWFSINNGYVSEIETAVTNQTILLFYE